jgi:iron(III) transport system permease protein
MSEAHLLPGETPASGPFRERAFAWARLDGWTAAALAVALLASVPVLVVLGFFLVPKGDVWRHLASTVLAGYIGNSVGLMLGVAAGTGFGGVATAWLVTMCRFPGRRLFEWALLLPLAVPGYVLAYTYTGLLDFAGPVQVTLRWLLGREAVAAWFPEVRSLPGAIVMLTLVLYPYVYILARAAFLEQSVCVLEASRTLGRGGWRTFFTVALPLARPAIVAGMALALMETLNDFGTVQHFAVDTFTTGIYRAWFGLQQPAAAAQLGALLMLFVLALVLIERASRGAARYHHTTGRYRQLPRYELSLAQGAIAFLLCLLPVLLGFLVPGGVLLAWAIETAPQAMDARSLGFALNSLLLSAVSAVLAVALALLLAYGLRLRPSKAMAFAVHGASLGYAVPGSVIAVGLLLSLGWLDGVADGALRAAFGIGGGLLLSGTVVALLYAYLVRFLAISVGAVEAGLGKVMPSVDGAARTLGLGAVATVRRVHLPILRGSLLSAALLVFVDVMKELPATMILRPFNFDTLAVRAYQLAKDELLREAAGPSLLIVLTGILPVVLLSRIIARSRPGHRQG